VNEAWIFLSIGYAGGDRRWVGLEGVIETADGLNHLIPLQDEFEAAISSLIAAGLVEARGLETRLTTTGAEAFAEAIQRDVGYIQHLVDLDEAWSARGYPDAGASSWSLDEEAWRMALDTYQRSMEARHPELRATIDDDD
jgi:hypothetical protein